MKQRCAVVVLGCRIATPPGVALFGAAGRRARMGARVSKAESGAIVIASGGQVWRVVGRELGRFGGEERVEANALAEELVREGVDDSVIVREVRSRTTRENARYTRWLLEERRITHVKLVTCSWHMARASALFRSEGFSVETFPADSGDAPIQTRAYRAVRERVAARLDRLTYALTRIAFIVALTVSCGHAGNPADGSVQDATIDAAASASALSTIANAEDTRHADLVTEEMRTSRDVVVRRRAARALARIADASSEAGLIRALGDEDRETVAWGAYGLGFSCKGHEESRVKALAARAASLDVANEVAATPTNASIDVHFAIARALGKCGGALAEGTLAAWVRAKGSWREPSAYGIGDMAARRGSLDDDTVTALLDASADGVSTALYPFARVERFNDAFSTRLLDAAKKSIAGPPSDVRIFAVRALAKTGEGGVPELSRVATSPGFSWSERIDAMRSLGKSGDAGRSAAVLALGRIVPDPNDAFAVLAAGGDLFGELVVGLIAIGSAPPPSATKILTSIANLKPAGDAPKSIARRFAELRCTAASLLAQGAFDSAGIDACDGDGEARDHARLQSLLRRPIIAANRRAAWIAFAKTERLKIREEAIAAIGSHRELGDAGLSALALAIADSKHPGVVAEAADVLVAHPERALVLSAKERKNALDPNAPPPTTSPDQDVSPAIAKALSAALLVKWTEDAIETRTSLLDAASALHVAGAKENAKSACGDSNITVREHATKALRALGETNPVCATGTPITAAKEIATTHGGKLILTTDAGTLSITFDADLAPIASTRILDLAKAGFYDNVVVHRVVPAFVVQLGDPQGDGYNGSGTSLRCETSPIPFGPLDVGIALAGRDTGSSQFFISLGRFPHLDGDYAYVGHAEGDWFGVAEGDVIRTVKVE